MVSFRDKLNQFANYRAISRPSITRATVDVTEQTARRALRLKKSDPLVYRRLTLHCRGLNDWRRRQVFIQQLD